MFHINYNMAGKVEPFTRKAMSTENKLLMATAYQAYCKMVKLIPELKEESRMKCDIAMDNESASVRSKVKKILLRI